MNRAVVTPWVDAVLGADRNQRVRAKQSLMASLVYLGLSAITGLSAWLGVIEQLPATVLIASMLSVSALFYAVIRSGRNLRFTADPALTLVQGLVCVLASSAAYVVAGPMRGAMLMTLLIGQFFGVFALSPLQARRMAGFGVVVMALTMGACAYIDPLRFAPREELLNFLMVALMLPTIGWLAGQLSAIRSKLRLQKAQLESALAQNRLLATQDELTGLSNRRHMTALMVAERGRQQRNRNPISMVLMDIDHFKHINDACGHQAGDQVLQIFADVITHGLRAGDSLARWGGEEFLLMLPNTAADDALVCVERMRGQLAARSFEHIAPKLAVTFSAGIGVCSTDDKLDTIIERADRAMYRAKTTGRNRTVVA
ncbi:MAG: GGDEF domain-containing protein [Cytophagales bacterium]|nr:GGDEF domain-containing protein [Rhizobacter sp.]